MPGTIHVSVVDFKYLPSSSTPSSVLVKVSMGKREYQTWEKGDFSFPLTNLRDSVTITLQDTEGNEISHRGIQTMSIVEKGSWDEFLPIEGGGSVHMKLQFVLSEEERNQIRSMRETAMKKKRDELLTGSLRYSEIASTASGIVTSSSRINHEVSDVSSAASSQDLAIHDGTLTNPQSAAGNEEETAFHRKQIPPNDTDGSEESSSAASPEVNPSISVQKNETKSRHVNVPERERAKFLQEGSSTTKKNDQPGKQDPLERTPSNVRKMITAFESSLAKDMSPGIKPPAAKQQSNKVELEDPKDLNLKEITKPAKLTSGRLKNLQEIQTHEMKRDEHIGIDKETESTAKLEWRKPQEDLERMSAVAAATVSGSRHEEDSGSHQPYNLLVNQRDPGGTAVMEGHGNGIHSSNSHENEHSSSESSGAWIFPDHARRLCITSGSKQVMDLVGGCGIQERKHEGKKSSSLPENVDKHSTQFGDYTEVKKGNKTSHELRKSRLESSSEVETSAGVVGQAIKVAIMVAFGTLVLLTRQRKPR